MQLHKVDKDMENFYIDLAKKKIEQVKKRLKINFIFTLSAVVGSATSIYMINLHPNSVWYYFSLGVNISSFIVFIMDRHFEKREIRHAQNMIELLKRGLTK